jgi:hypothetical protein
MQIEVDEIIEIPDYTDTERHKKLKNDVYLLARKDEPFDMQDLPSAEYKYYCTMYHIFKRLIAKQITPEQATAENAEAYKVFTNEQTIYNQRVYNLMEWNNNIKKSDAARVKISKAKNRRQIVAGIIECIEALTGDKTIRNKIETLEGTET